MAEKKEETKKSKAKKKDPAKPQNNGVKISTARVRKVITEHLNSEVSGVYADVRQFKKEEKLGKLKRDSQLLMAKVYADIEADAKRKFAYEKLKAMKKDKPEEYKKFKTKKSELLDTISRDPSHKLHVKGMDEEPDKNLVYLEIDKEFFTDFKYKEKELTPKEALSEVAARKVRFSQSAGVGIGAYFQYFVSQIAINGMFNCIHDGRKQVKLDDAVNRELAAANSRFDMFPLLACSEVYKKYMSQGTYSSSAKKNDKNQFRTYVSKVFHDIMENVPVTLGKNRIPKGIREQFSGCSISRDLRDFISEVLVENLEKVGDMCRAQLEYSGSKTITKPMISTVFRQQSICFSFNYDNLSQFIESTIRKHTEFVESRLEFTRSEKAKKKQQKESEQSGNKEKPKTDSVQEKPEKQEKPKKEKTKKSAE